MYTMASVLQHGSEQQKEAILPRIANGSLRLQAFGVTEPDAGSNTLRIKTFAKKVNGGYVINGQKIWTSRYKQSDMYLLLARTTPYEDVKKKTEGLSLFLVDIAKAGKSLQPRNIDTMLNHHTNEVFIENLEVGDTWRIGRGRQGLQYLLSSLNAERCSCPANASATASGSREGAPLRHRAHRVRQADRRQPGRGLPDRQGPHEPERRRTDAQPGCHAVRRRPALRRRGQHGQVPVQRGLVGSGRAPA
jgi:alkylation response protein AidB-like acyl-CoA dehydrogenase